MKTCSNQSWSGNRLTRPSADELEELHWQGGLTFREMGESFGLSKESVYHYMKRHGILARGARDRGIKIEKEGELAYILGVMLGDGYRISRENRRVLHHVVGDKIFADSLARALREVGLNPLMVREGGNFHTSENSKALHGWLNGLDVRAFIFKGTENVRAFVRGFYESRGSLRGHGKNSCMMSIYNRDEILIRLVDDCLKALGFRTNLFSPKSERNVYELYLLGGKGEVMRFLREIKPCVKLMSVLQEVGVIHT